MYGNIDGGETLRQRQDTKEESHLQLVDMIVVGEMLSIEYSDIGRDVVWNETPTAHPPFKQ